MRWIYESLIHDNKTVTELVRLMNEGTTPVWDGPIPTTFGGCVWHVGTVVAMIKNPIYKGEFYAFRHETIKTGEYNEAGREKVRMIERPRSEWIKIEVPQIVTPEEWALAQKCLKQNNTRSQRNTKRLDWLLSSLIQCARCGYTYASILGNTKRNPVRYYGCVSKFQEKARLDGVACLHRSYIRANLLEPVIWHAISTVIMKPQVILDSIDAESDQKLADYKNQLAYLEQSLDKLEMEWERWNRAYGVGVIGLAELQDYRNDITRRRKELEIDRDELVGRIERIESIEDRKAFVREILGQYQIALEHAKEVGGEVPDDLKRKVLRGLVDTIWVNDQTMTAKIDGVVTGTVDIMEIASELRLSQK
jgi:site-specific DNA recombinase